jgi:hypothetical protein
MISHSQGKLATECKAANAKLREAQAANEFTAIILSERWPGYRSILHKDGKNLDIEDLNVLFPMMLSDMNELYEGFKGPVVFVEHAPNTITGCHLRPHFFDMPCFVPSLAEHEAFKKAFSSFLTTTTLDARLVRPVESICPDEKCRITDDPGHLLYTDDVHLSVYGAQTIVPQILREIERPKELAINPTDSGPQFSLHGINPHRP